jgi:hypothetical protein
VIWVPKAEMVCPAQNRRKSRSRRSSPVSVTTWVAPSGNGYRYRVAWR